ncbi:MAG: Cof-type HAD-IIB family hydrolase, partial [Saprospiraceae bacterium]
MIFKYSSVECLKGVRRFFISLLWDIKHPTLLRLFRHVQRFFYQKKPKEIVNLQLTKSKQKMYQLVCSDIDGTLLDKNRQLSKRTIKALKAIQPQADIVLASSRMPKAMKHLQVELGIESSPLICYNGGLVLDYTESKNPKTLLSLPIPMDVLRFALQTAANTNIHISIYRNDDWYVSELDYWANREINNTKVEPTVTNQLELIKNWTTGAHKIMCMGPKEEIQVLYNALSAAYGNTVHTYRSKDTYIEISSKTISKATALERVLKEKYNFGMEKVVSFGDNYNDIDLLTASGKGVAVDNARDEVKAIANEITETNKNDGV